MPFKYAITDALPPYDAALERTFPFALKGRTFPHPLQIVPKEVAESHDPRHAYRQLVDVNGKALTDWAQFSRFAFQLGPDLTTIRKKNNFDPQPDFMGEMLKAGDFVLAYIKGHVELQVCEVLGFVRQGKIRVRSINEPLSQNKLRFSTEVVKVREELLGKHPEEEWHEEFKNPDFENEFPNADFDFS